MKKVSAIALAKTHYPRARRITDKRLRQSIAMAAAEGWHAAYYPTSGEPDRLVVLLRGEHPLIDVFDQIRDDPGAYLPLGLIEMKLGARIDSLAARDRLTDHGLIITDLQPGAIRLKGSDPRLARAVNFPRYSKPNRGWKVRKLVPDVIGLPDCPKRLRSERLLEAALLLYEYQIDASDIFEDKPYAHLLPAWTIQDRLIRDFAA
jgi:hypothetical protein